MLWFGVGMEEVEVAVMVEAGDEHSRVLGTSLPASL